MATPNQSDDDVPAGLRSSTPVNYSSTTKHSDVKSTSTAKPAAAVAKTASENVISADVQASRDHDALLIWQEELAKAQDRLKKGDPRAEGDIAGLQREIQRVSKQGIVAPVAPTTASPEVADDDEATHLKTATDVNYGTSPATSAATTPAISDKTKLEAGVGAAIGAYAGHKQRKNDAASAETQYAHLPPEARPVSLASLQRYINSQFSVQIPLEKLKELTGIDIRTMKEVQDARKLVEGSPAAREPVVKDVDGRRTTVSYRNTPTQTPIDISMYPTEAPSLMGRVGNAVSSGTKSALEGASKFLRPIAGGAVAIPQLFDAATDYLQKKPVDPTQVISGLGGIGMMSRSTPIGAAGALAQIPYAIRHREELARAMTMNDINPTAFPIGTAGADEPMVPRQ